MADLERILTLTPGALSQQWYEDGSAVDPGTVTVGVTRADGTVLITPGTATTGSATAARVFNLTTTHTALLDTLTVTWTSTLKGTLVSYVEVVGGFLFTIASLAAQVSGFTTAELVEMRTTVEQEIERELAFACVPRYTLMTLSGSGGRSLMLSPHTTAIRSITVDGTALTAPDLAALSYGLTGTVYSSTRSWTCGTNNIVVGYEHGLTRPPGGCDRVAKLLAKSWLVGQRSPIDDRAITFSTNDLGSYSLAVPGRGGSIFGIPDVDAWIASKTLKTGIA